MSSLDRDAYDAGLSAFNARDFVEALRILRPLAERGHADAQVRVAEILLYGGVGVGRLVRTDYPQAIEWLRRAVAQGNTRACLALAQCFDQGRGVPRSTEAAMDLLHRAAQQGDVQSQSELGRRYVFGNGVPQDVARAAPLLHAAAEAGEPLAQFNLARLYREGNGVTKDTVLAHVLYRIGGSTADDRREPDELEYLGLYLTPTQKVEADELIANWRPGQPLPRVTKTGGTN